MNIVSNRSQNTLQKCVTVKGFGLFHGADVQLELCPADADHGIVFQRTDLPGSPRVPALIQHVIPQERCTVIQLKDARVAVTEHVLAALAGLQVDNCLIKINSLEPPIDDGSALIFVEAIRKAGIVSQNAPRLAVRVDDTSVQIETDRVSISAIRSIGNAYHIRFILDYGSGPIHPQTFALEITPASFEQELANCRTFALEEEVELLHKNKLALRATTQNAVVFGKNGPIGTTLRRPNELVRHKILDCVGDFALLGADLIGKFSASRSGHRLNHEIIRQISSRLNISNSPIIADTVLRSSKLSTSDLKLKPDL